MDELAAARVLVFAEDRSVGETVVLTLNHGRFAGRLTTTTMDAVTELHTWQPHLAIVDLDAGGEALRDLGIDLVDNRTALPVIGLSRSGDLRAKLAAFQAGVDDVLTVPFAPDELVARAMVVYRRSYGTITELNPVVRTGDLELDILNRQVRVMDEIIHLTGLGMRMLYYLVANRGRVINRDELLDALWGSDFVSESNIVDRHVRTLRMKLQNNWRKPRFIETVTGQGYRFMTEFDPSKA